MLSLVTVLTLLPFSLAAVTPNLERSVEKRDSACTDVHLILARGNGESYPGRVGQLGDATCNGLASCDYENIQFVATQAYCSQLADGVNAGISQVEAYAKRCPNSKIVLGGYSLGAHIVGDILGGGGGSFYSCSEPTIAQLPANVGSRVNAALLFGDVRHTANMPYNTGPGSADDGQYPRTGGQLSGLNAYSNKLRSYCLATDPICALGNDGKSHETYMDVYSGEASNWIKAQLGYEVSQQQSSAAAASASSSVASIQSEAGYTSTSTSASSTSTGSSIFSTITGTASGTGAAFLDTSSTGSSSSVSKTVSSLEPPEDGPTNTSTSSSSKPTSFAPFVFAPPPVSSGASTSTYNPDATTSTYNHATATATSYAKLASTTATTPSSSVSTRVPTALSSNSGFINNAGAHLTTIVTLVVIKVLVF